MSQQSHRARPRVRRSAVLAAAALAATGLAAAPAHATTGIGRYTYNRPATTEAGGAEYITWADQSAQGEVHIAKLNSSMAVVDSWYYSLSSTYLGSGPSIASVDGQGVVVAWDDASSGDIYLAYLESAGFVCVTDMRYWLESSTGTPQGVSHDTPFLSTERYDGIGQLYLTWVDASTNHLHISPVNAPTAADCTADDGFGVDDGATTDLSGQTSFNGPALAVSGYTGTTGGSGEYYWLTWAGTDSGHHLNVLKLKAEPGAYGQVLVPAATQVVESTHATLTDMGGDYDPATGNVWMTYCGTAGTVYYQQFAASGAGGGTETSLGASCDISTYTTGGVTYYSGGVGVGYDYTNAEPLITWADKTSYQIEADLL